MTQLPRLMDRKTIASELGVPLSGAETVMRKLRLKRVGRRVYVRREDLEAWLEETDNPLRKEAS